MQRRILILGALLLFALAASAPAQQFGPFNSAMSAPGGSSGTASSFFSKSMARPDVTTTMSFRPTVPTPLNFNIRNMMPSLPGLQDTMLLRNVFGSRPQTGFMLPKQATPPPKKK